VTKVRAYKLTEEELKGIQYYLSRDVVYAAGFKRKGEETKAIESGRASFEDTFVREERIIKIEKGTPGVCLSGDQYGLRVDFGRGVVLLFESREPAKFYFLATRSLVIDGLTYTRQTFDSAYLLAKASFRTDTVEKVGKRAAPGKRVDEPEG